MHAKVELSLRTPHSMREECGAFPTYSYVVVSPTPARIFFLVPSLTCSCITTERHQLDHLYARSVGWPASLPRLTSQ